MKHSRGEDDRSRLILMFRPNNIPSSSPRDTVYCASPAQRGIAADIRQHADNGDIKLSKDERNFLNKVIHDPSYDHNPSMGNIMAQIIRDRLNS